MVDAQGRLLTFGSGKAGQLGHGDTNKKAVGRTVKALQHAAVRSVACGADFMLAVTCGRGGPCGGGSGSGGRGGGGLGASGRAKEPSAQPGGPPLEPASGTGAGAGEEGGAGDEVGGAGAGSSVPLLAVLGPVGCLGSAGGPCFPNPDSCSAGAAGQSHCSCPRCVDW